MKKLITLTACLVALFAVSSCKKDKDNGNGNPSSQSCRLKSNKQKITESGMPDKYGGFAIYYDNSGKIIRTNQYDSLGNEDSANYVVLSYSGDNLTDVKVYQDAALSTDFVYQYNSKNLVSKRSYSLSNGGNDINFDQVYFYDNDNKLSYTVLTLTIPVGTKNIVVTDSALYQNYTGKGRPAGIIVYRSTVTPFSSQPYDFYNEFAYEYDANGNRVKESLKDSVSNPFRITRTATYDPVKTTNEATAAYRVITRIIANNWDDPNINTKDIDLNLILSEDSYDNKGVKTGTANTTYTFNDRNNPATSTEINGGTTTVNTFTYDCK